MEFWYDDATSLVNFEVTVEQSSYFAMGYGVDMFDVNMVAWIANSASSSQKTMWSTSESGPATSTEEYTTTIVSYDAASTLFTSTRTLNPGFTNSYVIPLDTDLNMVWAYADAVSTNAYHGGNKGIISVNFPSTGGCSYTNSASFQAKIHGAIMWFCWTILSLVQVTTNRYMIQHWQSRQLIHSVVGFVSFILTMAGFLIVMQSVSWSISYSVHNILGLIFTFLSLAITVSGSFAIYLMQYGKIDINEVKLRGEVYRHKIFGYILIFSV